MVLTPNALTVLKLRYLKKGKNGKPIEAPETLFRRVAHNLALADANYAYSKAIVKQTEKKFFELMNNLDFLPNSPTLFNAGRQLQQLAGCFVLPVEDDIDSIFQALHQTAVIHKTGGGTGFSFSRLRPRGDIVQSTQGVASGPVSFMKIFDCATEQIKQGGKRRGANMGILRVDHPDIEEFITIKSKEKVLQNFNISVGVTDKFMKAVKENKRYDLVNPRTGQKGAVKNARKIFHLICQEAWKRADPGVIFLDEINRHNPTPQLGKIESTNPCGEVPLLPFEACNLGSINVAHFVKDGKIEKEGKVENGKVEDGKRENEKRENREMSKVRIDYPRLKEVVWTAIHFLDNVIDRSKYPLPEIETMVKGNRKIGLGIMGFADLLIQLGLRYDSKEGLQTAEQLMKFISEEAKKASVFLAKQRGGPGGVFPNFKGSLYDTGKAGDRVRNATRTSIAPTGTISIIAGCSSGIEPLYGVAFAHTVVETQRLVEVNKYFVDIAKKKKFYSQKLMDKVMERGGVQGLKEVPHQVQNLFRCAQDISPEYHVRMQAIFQKYTDNAVSKTVNLPERAPVKDIEKIYQLAYDLGCKGISIYRYGSKKGQVLTVGEKRNKGRRKW